MKLTLPRRPRSLARRAVWYGLSAGSAMVAAQALGLFGASALCVPEACRAIDAVAPFGDARWYFVAAAALGLFSALSYQRGEDAR